MKKYAPGRIKLPALFIFSLLGFFHLHAQIKPLAGTAYALVIGISDYQDEQITDLNYAHRDAEAFAGFLYSKAGGSLPAERVTLLLNSQASFGNIVNALDWLTEVAKEGDRIIIYFSGHGDVETKTVAKRGFLLAYDTPYTNYRANSLGLDMLGDYFDTYTQVNKAKVLLIADACHAGNLAGRQVNGAQITSTALIENFPNQVRVLSCQPEEYSLEGAQWGEGRGVFSFYLINGLLGLADKNQDKSVNLLELQAFLQDNVPAQTAPQSQVPLVYGGNMQERIASVDPTILRDLQKQPLDKTLTFAQVDSRGIEASILNQVDTSLAKRYRAYQKALAERRFFEPKGASANDYYEQLQNVPALEPLHNILRRNFAAALLEEVQRDVNRTLKDQEEIGGRGDLAFLPRVQHAQACVNRTLELLGDSHYLANSLKARWHHYEALKYYYQDLAFNSTFLFKAIQEAQTALAYDSLMADIYNTLGLLLYSKRDKQSHLYFQKATELAPTWAIPHLNLLGFYRAQRDYTQSLHFAEKVMEIAPHRWYAHAYLAVEVERKDPAAAIDLYKKAAAFPDCWPFVYNSLVGIYRRIGDTLATNAAHDNYLAAIRKAIIDRPRYSSTYYMRILINEILKKDPQADLEKILQKELPISPKEIFYGLGNYYYLSNTNLEKSEFYYLKALELDPNNLGAIYELGQLLQFKLNKLTDAKKLFEKILSIDSVSILAPINLSGIYINESKFDSAEAILQKAIAIRPDFAMNYAQMGHLFAAQNEYRKTESFYLKALACNESDIYYLKKMTILYFYDLGSLEKAIVYYKKILHLYPEDSDALHRIIDGFIHSGQFEQAKSWVEKLKETDKGDYYYQLSRSYFFQEKQDSALWAAQEAVALNSQDSVLQFGLGYIYTLHNRHEEAETIFSRLVENRPGFLSGYIGLWTVFDKTNRHEEMEKTAIRCLANSRYEWDSLTAYVMLAITYSRINRQEDYEKTLQKIQTKFTDPWMVSYSKGQINSYLGRVPEALQNLEHSITLGFNMVPILEDPFYAPIMHLPEFKALMKKYFPREND